MRVLARGFSLSFCCYLHDFQDVVGVFCVLELVFWSKKYGFIALSKFFVRRCSGFKRHHV